MPSSDRIAVSELQAVLRIPVAQITTKTLRRGDMILPNDQDEPRPQPARLVLLGARGVTAVGVGSSAWLGIFVFLDLHQREIIFTKHAAHNRYIHEGVIEASDREGDRDRIAEK